MHIIFPPQQLPNYEQGLGRQIKFGETPLERFVHGRQDGTDGPEADQLIGKRLFYILRFIGKEKPGSRKKLFKVGISRGIDGSARLKSYYNSFGQAGAGRPCEGVNILFLCGTGYVEGSNPYGLQVSQLERFVKRRLKDQVLRGTEWIECTEAKLVAVVTNWMRRNPQALVDPPRTGLRSQSQ